MKSKVLLLIPFLLLPVLSKEQVTSVPGRFGVDGTGKEKRIYSERNTKPE